MVQDKLIQTAEQLSVFPQCVMVWDRSLCCKAVNKNTPYNLFGLESEFIKHQFFSDLPIGDAARKRIRKAFDTARATGRTTELLQSLYINNQKTEVETSFVPQFEDGSFTGVMTVCHCSNGLKELRSRTENLIRATAHDLRTPLNNLKNLSKLMQAATNDEMRQSVGKRMNETVSVMNELLEGLMEMADLRNNDSDTIEVINIHSAIEEVINVFSDEFKTIGATVSKNIRVSELSFSKGYFRSILFNLISNAVKYRSDDRTLNIRIETFPAPNGLWLELSDNGMGIDLAESGNELFKPFVRLTDKAEGRGIGLSLVKGFVESVGGEITVVSEPGAGTSFRILLPAQHSRMRQYVLFD